MFQSLYLSHSNPRYFNLIMRFIFPYLIFNRDLLSFIFEITSIFLQGICNPVFSAISFGTIVIFQFQNLPSLALYHIHESQKVYFYPVFCTFRSSMVWTFSSVLLSHTVSSLCFCAHNWTRGVIVLLPA